MHNPSVNVEADADRYAHLDHIMEGFEHDQAVKMGIAPSRDRSNINLNLRFLLVDLSIQNWPSLREGVLHP